MEITEIAVAECLVSNRRSPPSGRQAPLGRLHLNSQSAQLLTFRIFLFKPVELYQITINSSYCDGVLKL